MLLIEEEILPLYNPDFLIVSFGRNDDVLEKYPDRVTINKNIVILKLEKFFDHFGIYKALKRLLIKNQDHGPAGRAVYKEKKDYYYRSYVDEQKDLVPRVTLDETIDNLQKIVNITQKHKTGFLFLNTVLNHLYPERHKVIDNFFKENNLDYIDIYTMLEESIEKVKTDPAYKSQVDYYRNYLGDDLFNSNDRFYVYFNLSHPNSIGQHLIADAVFKNLVEIHILDK